MTRHIVFDTPERIRQDLSPLRYPGGKRKLAPFIAHLIEQRNVPIDLFIEPFAGGAAVSLYLLERNLVKSVALFDADYNVASFWRTVFNHNHRFVDLIEMIANTPITLEEWQRQKDLKPSSPLEAAFKCLFLNRTSFSGVMHRAGPIGGMKQTGKDLIDARFNKDKICNRLIELNKLRDRVPYVQHGGFDSNITAVEPLVWENVNRKHQELLIYCDPPYYEKGHLLYQRSMSDGEHVHLRNILKESRVDWLLSYDNHPRIRELYEGYKIYDIPMSYSANIATDEERPTIKELLIVGMDVF